MLSFQLSPIMIFSSLLANATLTSLVGCQACGVGVSLRGVILVPPLGVGAILENILNFSELRIC